MKYYSLVLVLLLSTTPASVGIRASECADIPLIEGNATIDIPLPVAAEPALTVVSLNMAKETRRDRVLEDLRQSFLFKKADIWMLQESGAIEDIAGELNMYYAYAPVETLDDGNSSGLAILSRYPIAEAKRLRLPRYNLVFNSRCRIALSATVQSPTGPVRVVNAHLDTRITLDQRLRQTMPLLDLSDGSPAIVGGDFNTADIRWIGNLLPVPGQKHTEAIRDLFLRRGFQSPLDRRAKTFKLIGLPLHLDWIFTRRLKPVSSGTEIIDFSDHNAVWVDMLVQ